MVQILNLTDVQAIAELAKLDLSDDELNLYTEQLSQILGYFELLQAVDTSHVTGIPSVIPLKSVLRPDQAQRALSPELAVSNAPDAEANQFKVSAVLGDD